MKKKFWTGAAVGCACAVVAAVGFFGKGIAENIDTTRINVLRDESRYSSYTASAYKDAEAQLGTEENPFVILEILPSKSYGEAGFMIEGCEPVEIKDFETKERVEELEKLDVHLFGFSDKIFLDEIEEGALPNGWEKVESEQVTVFGYYERVKDGTGNFERLEGEEWNPGANKNIPKFEKVEKGNWIWHTAEPCKTEGWYENPQQSRMEIEETEEPGSRVYSYRTDIGYYDGKEKIYRYTHYNDFIRTSLGLVKPETIENFCITVKTMEPEEINEIYGESSVAAKEDWIQSANLIWFGEKNHIKAIRELWQKEHEGYSIKYTEYCKENDLSWKSVMAIMKRVGSDEIPAAIWMASSILKVENTPLETQKKNVNYHLLDWNGKYLQYAGRSGPGSSFNIYKLGLMISRWDVRLFYSLFIEETQTEDGSFGGGNWIDENGNLLATEERNGSYLSDNEKVYWGIGTFLPTATGVDATDIWNRYHVDVTSKAFPTNYIHGNVFIYDTEKGEGNKKNSLIHSGIAIQLINTGFLNEFMESLGINECKNNFLGIQYILKDILEAEKGLKKTKLKVLVLEPCNDFSEADFAIKLILKDYTGKLELVHQTTAEFIGRTESLCGTYDMIYMGLSSGALNTDTNGKTVYNESVLNGYVYLHVGDKITPRAKDRWDTASGVIQELYKWLMNFINKWIGNSSLAENYWKMNYAVNWIDGVSSIRMPGNDITEKKKEELDAYVEAGYPVILASGFAPETRDGLVDKASYVYEFVKDAKDVEADISYNKFLETDTRMLEQLTEYLKLRNLEIELLEAPAEYSESVDKEGSYIQLETEGVYKGSYLLNYRFRLKAGKANKTYTARLYLDRNRDGRFSDNEVNQVKSGLKTGQELSLKTRLGKEWFGAIPWKLEVEEDGKNKTASVTGLCAAARGEGTEREKISVLQISQYESAGETINLAQNTKFQELVKKLEDYEITFTVLSIDEFEKVFSKGSGKGRNDAGEAVTVVKEGAGEKEVSLEDFSMLIFGFADEYGNIGKTSGAFDWLRAYIAEGKSVLFTHDTTSFNNNPELDDFPEDSHKFTGYNVNQYLRGDLGMDRFDILHQLHGTETEETKRVESAGKTDKAWSLNSESKETEYAEKHGYTYYAAKRIAGMFYKRPSGLEQIDIILKGNIEKYLQKLTYKGLTIGNGAFETNQVTRINEGQITRYPYYIEDTFETAPTHGQYYQLNMEDDEIVVWYTMEGGTGDYEVKGELYGLSPKDTSNNYYIYNKANITYSGIGHSKNPTQMELKLLVNTIIAAYKQAAEPPYINLLDADYIEEKDKTLYYSGYLSFDYGEDSYEENSEDWIEFVPVSNGNQGELLKVGVYQTTSEEKKLYTVMDSAGREVTEKLENKSGEMVWKLESEKTYYIAYDRSKYDENNPPKFLFTIENTEKIRGKDTQVTLYRRELFNLD